MDESLDVHVTTHAHDHTATVRCSASGSMAIRFPGQLLVSAQARYQRLYELDDTDSHVHHPQSQVVSLPLTVEIRTPDGQLFAANHVTLNDLRRFRDLHGASQGAWSYTVHGESEPIPVGLQDGEVSALDGQLSILVREFVGSSSAPPLVNDRLGAALQRRYVFDLYRVGMFVATATPEGFLAGLMASRRLRLFDPDGVQVAASDTGHLTFPVSLQTLDKSRDIHGSPRLWALEVLPSLEAIGVSDTLVWATVVATTRMHTSTIKSRIDDLIGAGGSKVSVYGDMQLVEAKLLARLKILDADSAGTIDILGLLDKVLKRYEQDPGVDIHEITANVPYIVWSRSRDFPYETHVSLEGVKVDAIDIAVGASQHIQPPIPAVRIDVAVEGDAVVKLGGFPIANVSVNGNRIALEAGVRRNVDGSLSAETWIADDVVDIDLSWEAVLATGISSLGLLTLGAAGLASVLEDSVNDSIVDGFQKLLSDLMNQVPSVLAMMLGGDFTYQFIGVDGEDIVFEYIAPLEPDPRPFRDYLGAIGRTGIQLGPEIWQFTPHTLGDTWSTQNLAKIEHLVIVMMENRSFDHVLGYRAQLAPGEDGLTPELLAFLQSQQYTLPWLGAPTSDIPPDVLGLKTKFPMSVGHHVADVAQQLSEKIADASGRTILSPKGFVDNFGEGHSIASIDVAGYYTGADLPFTRFLAENYGYCQRYFSSHPGPTMPNRMYWLSGDLQYDRTGEAVLDNTNSDAFQLSRALTIFDVLTRKGVGWRVYESFPSVAMLRMFARYAPDDTNIVPISRLPQDVAQGNLPAVTVIEPMMHSAPENDDHPIADMHDGQMFLKHVYDTLRSNGAVWQKTALVITYDEHGGFYDHVLPPLADIRMRPMVVSDGGPAGPPPFTASPLLTNYGLRVPTFVVSPWAPAGKGPDLVLDHCSIAKTILARFCGAAKPFVSDRVNASRTFDAYLTESSPRMDVPASPSLVPLPHRPPRGRRTIVTPPISRRKMMNQDVEFHDLTGTLARLLGR